MKSGRVGLDTTHELIPVVIQPIAVVLPEVITLGFATSTIVGLLIVTLHWAPVVCDEEFTQLNVYVAVFVPAGGVAIIVDVAPDRAPLVVNPPPVAVDALPHAYEIATDMPTSAICG